MITITVSKQPWDDHNYTTQATFTISEDALVTEAIHAFVNALLLETYGLEAIRNSLQTVSLDLQESIEAHFEVMQDRL